MTLVLLDIPAGYPQPVVRLPKSCVLPFVDGVIYCILSDHCTLGSYPPLIRHLVAFDVVLAPTVVATKSPKSTALPVEAVCIKSITLEAGAPPPAKIPIAAPLGYSPSCLKDWISFSFQTPLALRLLGLVAMYYASSKDSNE